MNPPAMIPTMPAGLARGEYGYVVNGILHTNKGMSVYEGQAEIAGVAGGLGGGTKRLTLVLPCSDGSNSLTDQIIIAPFTRSVPQVTPFVATGSQTGALGTYYPANTPSTASYRSVLSGNLTILKLDTIENVVSGVFEYDGLSRSDWRKAVVISGYFNDVPITIGSFGQGTISASINDTAYTSIRFGTNQITASYSFGIFHLASYGVESGIERAISFTIDSPKVGEIVFDTASRMSSSVRITDYARSSADPDRTMELTSGTISISSFDTVHRRISARFQLSGQGSGGSSERLLNGVIDNVQFRMP